MVSESPFLLTKVECPVCKTINEFEQVKVGAYVEENRDTDFCPTEITWRYPKYSAYNPLVFFAATCSHCFYTRELTNSYREWKSDNAFRTYRLKTVKAKHLEELSSADSAIRQLGEQSDNKRSPNESAIVKLHLAIFDELLAEHPSLLDLGRFYLRIAWIFRSLNHGDNPNQMFLSGLLRELTDKYQRLQRIIDQSQTGLSNLNDAVLSQYDSGHQLSADIQSDMLPYKERYESEINALSQSLDTVNDHMDNFSTLLKEYRGALLGETHEENTVPFGQYSSLGSFLLHMRDYWSNSVVNENEAIEKAIHYYKEAYASGRDIAAGPQQIQASYLIAELSRRIGDHDGAREFFTSTIKSGQEFIYQNRRDQSRTALTRKILELAIEQGRTNLSAMKPA